LDLVRNNTNLTPISFDDAVKKAYLLDGKLKRHLYCFSQNSDVLFDNRKRVWEFRYKMSYEKHRVKVIDQDPLEVCWIYKQMPNITIDKIKISRV
jgi:hypothetical protein